MKKCLLLILLLPLFLNAQVTIKGSVTGYGKNQAINYFLPIGLYSNMLRDMHIYKIKDDSTFNLKLDVPRQMFIKINIAGKRQLLLVKPGDVVTMDLKKTNVPSEEIKISGSNAAANSWYNFYMRDPFNLYSKDDSLINICKTESANGAFYAIKRFIAQQYAPLDSLFNRGEIDKVSLSLYKKEVTVVHASVFILKISQLKYKDKIILNNIAALKDSIYKNYPPIDPDNIRLTSGDGYFLFSDVRDFIKSPVKANPVDMVFGVYNQYLALPPLFTEDILGDALLFQKLKAAGEFDFKKGYAVFKRKFPNSKYINAIEAYLKQDNLLAKTNDTKVIIDSVSNFKTVKEIVDHYKGQNIYIDLWATWCVPCQAEFPYYKDLDDDFKQHNITSVYISIDDPSAKKHWKDLVLASHLKGTHLIVNKDLMNDIKDKVFDYKQVSIPRYLLFNKNGELINGDAPRPSHRGELITLFKDKL